MAAPEPISVSAPALPGRASASQSWRDVAFVHWRVDSADVAPLLPAGTRPDEFDGSSWLGLIAFELSDATLFGSPPIPYLGRFAEINVRLYAIDDLGRRGVVFVSLEAARLAAVLGARAAFSLPYFWASTRIERAGRRLTYSSQRRLARSQLVVEASERRVDGDPLADFLTARWALFVRHRGRTMLLPNAHEPWQLFEATLESISDELVAVAGFAGVIDRRPESVLFSPGVKSRFGTGRVVNSRGVGDTGLEPMTSSV
ncbi:DUF2071 domain-containing protein [soil metagenome]